MADGAPHAYGDAELPEPAAVGGAASGLPRAPWRAEAWQPAGVGTWLTTTDLARWLSAVLDGTAPGLAATDPCADYDDDRGDR